MPSNWSVVLDLGKWMVIRDEGGPHVSVTNDAEGVVALLVDRLKGRRLFYIDSSGDVDELLVAEGKFAGFQSGAPIELAEYLGRACEFSAEEVVRRQAAREREKVVPPEEIDYG